MRPESTFSAGKTSAPPRAALKSSPKQMKRIYIMKSIGRYSEMISHLNSVDLYNL